MKKFASLVVTGSLSVALCQGYDCFAIREDQCCCASHAAPAAPFALRENQRSCVSRAMSTFPSAIREDQCSCVFRAVSTAPELVLALEEGKAKKLEQIRIKLVKDITLKSDLKLPSGTELDLNGYTLFISPNVSITVGEKTEVIKERVVSHKPEVRWNYSRESGFTEYAIPAYNEVVEDRSYSYDDDCVVNVFSKNGKGRIIGLRCKDAPDDIKRGEYAFKGKKGGTGGSSGPIFSVLSGSLYVENLIIKACDGGTGGRATYAGFGFIHGGSGGDGGDGGKGADVFFVEPEHGKVLNMGSCLFVPGLGGLGGKGSRHNPEYWISAGSDGERGSRGKDGRVINCPECLVS